MYILLKNDGTSFYLQEGSSYFVGRKDTNFILMDNTVSKKHARITIRNRVAYLEDLNSSNKTWVNGSSIPPSKEVPVTLGSEIKFGTRESIFVLKKDILLVAISGLNREEKIIVKDLIMKMSGAISANWSRNCSHIVVNSLVLTEKVLCGLVTKQPIVTIEYFKQRYHCAVNSGSLPLVGQYRPRMDDDNLHRSLSIDYEVDRSCLFKNKTFVFPTSDAKAKMEKIIDIAGGRSIAFDKHPIKRTEVLKQKTEYIFIITKENTQSDESEFIECIKILVKEGKRSVPMQEIAMAILLGNCEKDCNTDFNKVGHLISGGESVTLDKMTLVMETQSQMDSQNSTQGAITSSSAPSVIPETPDVVEDSVTISDDDDVPETGNKRIGEKLASDEVKKSKFDKRVGSIPKGSQIGTTKKVQSQLNSFLQRTKNVIPESQTSIKRKSEDLEDMCLKKPKQATQKAKNMSPFSGSKLNQNKDSQNSNESAIIDISNVKDATLKLNPLFGIKSQPQNPFANINSKQVKGLDSLFSTGKSNLETKDKPTASRLKKQLAVLEEPSNIIELDSDLQIKKPTRSMSANEENKLKCVMVNDSMAKMRHTKSTTNSKNAMDSAKSTTTATSNMVDSTKSNVRVNYTNSEDEMNSMRLKNNRNATKLTNNMDSTSIREMNSTMFQNIDNNGDNVLTSTRLEDNTTAANITSSISLAANCNRWLSKTSESATGTKSIIQDDADENMRHFIETFKTKINVVSSASLIISKPMHDLGGCTTNIMNSTLSNYKKFKKVKPLHEQCTIIPKSSYVKIVCCGASPSEPIDDEEDEEGSRELERRKQSQTCVVPAKKKKFNIF